MFLMPIFVDYKKSLSFQDSSLEIVDLVLLRLIVSHNVYKYSGLSPMVRMESVE